MNYRKTPRKLRRVVHDVYVLGRKRVNFKEHVKWIDSTTLVMQVGLTMAGSILFCLAIGYYLDKWLGTKPIFIIVFILLGIVGGGVTVYRQIMDATEKDERRDSSDGRSA